VARKGPKLFFDMTVLGDKLEKIFAAEDTPKHIDTKHVEEKNPNDRTEQWGAYVKKLEHNISEAQYRKNV
jgi:hypothetical protein